MIQKFNQFVNENANHQTMNRVFQAIDAPVSDFVDRIQERTKIFVERINELTANVSKAVEDVMTECENIIVGEPIVDIDERSLWDVEIRFNTNIPNNDEAWETDESPAEELDIRLYDIVKRYDGVKASVLSTANEDGNCVICISADIVYKTNFGEFADAISKFGEEY
jgi:hypothetical protein